MEYILRREGLALKFRLILELFSMAIIISFPILVGSLGILFACMVYLFSIAVLSWYFIRVSQGSSWYLKQTNNNDEVYADERLIDKTKVITLDIEDDTLANEDKQPADMAAKPSTLIETLPDDVSAEQVNEETSGLLKPDKLEENTPASSQADLSEESMKRIVLLETNSSALADGGTVQMNETETGINVDKEVNSKDDTVDTSLPEIIHMEESMNMEESIHKDEPENNEEPVHKEEPENKEEPIQIEEPVHTEEVIYTEERLPMEEEAAILSTDNAALITMLAEEPEAEILPEVIVPVEDLAPAETLGSEGVANDLAAAEQLDHFIENGFAMKQAQRFVEAMQYFEKAAAFTADEELKYLLTMETVELHKEMGMYAQAEQVLFHSSNGKAYTRTDIIDKINRQLSYVRLLSLELDRLGLSNTPIGEVPSEIKKSITEILKM